MATANLAELFGIKQSHTLPVSNETALFIGMLYERLGGGFIVSSNGTRQMGRPEPCVFEMNGEVLPQLPFAQPHNQLLNDEQWRGAMRMLDCLISALSSDARTVIFDHLAPVVIDDRELVPSIEEPKRGDA